MYKGSRLSLTLGDEGFAKLVFDYPEASMNTFAREAVREFTEVLELLESSAEVKGLLIASDKSSFMAGADVTEFEPVFVAGEAGIAEFLQANIDNFKRLESLPFATVVAINGVALGGALEMSLACDFRVLDETARVGLPETKLGIIPGWGGTVRLPRIAGVDTAVEWIASGEQYSARQALTAQVADAVVAPEQLRAAALDLLRACAAGEMDYQGRRAQKRAAMALNDIEAGLAFTAARGMVAARAGTHYPAPVAAVDLLAEATRLTAHEAQLLETRTFVAVAASDTARALTGVFLADQQVMKKARQWQARASQSCRQAAVLGAGIMGGGIACQSAVKGVPVVLKDIAREGIELGLKEARQRLSRQVERGRLSPAQMGETLQRIQPSLGYEDFAEVQLVVEAVVENRDVKQRVLAEVEAELAEGAVLASNTSTIAIGQLAESLQRPAQFCGMHFFNPVHAMPLVEVIRGPQTAEDTLAQVMAYALALGKKPVLVNDCAGFLVNRVLFPYFQGLAMLLRDGADMTQVDQVMENWGWPMGPAHLLDVVGLDTARHAERVMADAYPDRMRRDFTAALDVLHETGRLGQKNGKGFYDYQADRKGRLQKLPSDEAAGLIAGCSSPEQNFTAEDIIERMMLPMVTELVRCLQESVVASPAEADMAMVYGLGFPPFRGGVLRWIDTLGASRVSALAERWSHLGPLYEVPVLLREKAQSRGFFYPQGEQS